jgi:hypothetical protein
MGLSPVLDNSDLLQNHLSYSHVYLRGFGVGSHLLTTLRMEGDGAAEGEGEGGNHYIVPPPAGNYHRLSYNFSCLSKYVNYILL